MRVAEFELVTERVLENEGVLDTVPEIDADVVEEAENDAEEDAVEVPEAEMDVLGVLDALGAGPVELPARYPTPNPTPNTAATATMVMHMMRHLWRRKNASGRGPLKPRDTAGCCEGHAVFGGTTTCISGCSIAVASECCSVAY